jgi:beta-N-acetylhexosaminidase
MGTSARETKMRKHWWIRLLLIALILIPMIPTQLGLAAPSPQEGNEELRAQDLLERMTPEERVGQLFLVTFTGTKVGPESEIFDLIYNHYVGGVILLDKNNNFPDSETSINDTWSLINQLQTNRFSASQEPRLNPDTGENFDPAFIPLFVGISQEGDGYPTDQIVSQLTPLPSQLSIGATWDPEFAKQVGRVNGDELSSLGFNLLIGPSLDVNETPKGEGVGDLGVRTFGGDPFWVGEMGRAYISGVHEGSDERMAVVGKHFPGLGSADRLPEDEVATVRKSLEQLKQIELAPFFAVTGNAETPEETTDALLTSHIRYQGLQGNIRATTRPVSFDQTALSLLMDLPALTTWRTNGGIMISDDIGSKAVRDLYDPTGEGFVARRAALDAFLAGNDLLYMGGFLQGETSATEDETIISGYYAMLDTLEFFTQKYREDPGFAEQVDASVLRILSLKYKLYSFFTLTMVLPSGEINDEGLNDQVGFSVAQQAATLINPSFTELENVLPTTPTRSDRIVIFTDTYSEQKCLQCPIRSPIAVDALEQAILDLYGSAAGGVVSSGNIASHSFLELQKMMDGQAASSAVDTDIRRAQWIIFLALDLDSERLESYALRRFLSERPDLARDKRIIAFAANAPYYLDATDISKLTAFYGLYSKTPSYVDVAARLLFKEIQPEGASPVSIPGVGYDLISATSPDPEQEIILHIDLPGYNPTDEAILSLSEFRIGDSIPVKIGTILDYNGNPVPDNTPVEFRIYTNGIEAPAITSATAGGVAKTNILIEQSGLLEIQAITDSAQSNMLTLNIPEETPSPTPPPTVIPTEEPTSTPSPTAEILISTPAAEPPEEPDFTGVTLWLLAICTSCLTGWLALRVGAILGRVRWGVRWGLATVIGGLLAYSYAVLQLPGAQWAYETPYHLGLMLVTLLGALVGWGIGVAFRFGMNGKR